MLNILILLVLFLVPASVHAEEESVYERVMRTGTIKCGYAVWPPYFIKDVNTAETSGIFHDYVEEMGDMIGLEVQWTEELGWGDYIAGLKANRFDLYCPFTFPNAQRARESDFTIPVIYIGMEAVVRIDDARFDHDPDKMNHPHVTIVSIEGATPQIMAYDDFPNAQKLDLPQLSSQADSFQHVIDGKADIAFSEAMAAAEFMKENPGVLKIVPLNQPLRFSGATLSMKRGEDEFRRLLDHATREMLYTGKIEKIIRKYEHTPGLLRRVDLPFEGKE